jgi:hypothetical protein
MTKRSVALDLLVMAIGQVVYWPAVYFGVAAPLAFLWGAVITIMALMYATIRA